MHFWTFYKVFRGVFWIVFLFVGGGFEVLSVHGSGEVEGLAGVGGGGRWARVEKNCVCGGG